MQFHPNERLVTIGMCYYSTSVIVLISLSVLIYYIVEKTSCHNVYDINHNDMINRVEFSWNSSHEAVVAFSVSSDSLFIDNYTVIVEIFMAD